MPGSSSDKERFPRRSHVSSVMIVYMDPESKRARSFRPVPAIRTSMKGLLSDLMEDTTAITVIMLIALGSVLLLMSELP